MIDPIIHERLKRKLERRDKKIAGLERELRETRLSLARLATTLNLLPNQIERAVTHAMCNMRMIPVYGHQKNEKILEVRTFQEPTQKDGA